MVMSLLFNRTLLKICVLPLIVLSQFFAPMQSAAQQLQCSDADYSCLQEAIVAACRSEVASLQSCTQLLDELRNHQHSDSIMWSLAIASNYLLLSESSEVAITGHEALTDGQVEGYRQEARGLLLEVLEEQPDNVEALLGLSVLSDNNSVQLEYLRRAAIADPANTFASQGLVRRLLNSGSDEDIEEAARTFLNSFREMPSGTTRWLVAKSLVDIYRSFDKSQQLEVFTDELSSILDLDNFVTNPGDAVARQVSLPLTYCDSSLVNILGVSHCLSSIDELIELAGAGTESRELINIASNAVILAGQSDDLRDSIANWREFLLEKVEVLMSLNEPVAALYEAHANLVTGEERILALLNAIEYAPDNGEYYYRLGLIYHDSGNWDDAIAMLQQARVRLPEWRLEILDRYLNEARENSSQ